ncbi:MAG: hypothetical protein KKB03_00945 [Nanoarchaeota archaeon]|nr:hypothetical protein [Nanoarchaeota archaeon]MBU2519796.1 hypothetical protein [Nanoarchaeota archaeon]
MNTRNFKPQNVFVISSAVAISAFIFSFLGNPTNVLFSIIVSVLMGVFYFIIHHNLNRYSKKRQKNTAVRDFL